MQRNVQTKILQKKREAAGENVPSRIKAYTYINHLKQCSRLWTPFFIFKKSYRKCIIIKGTYKGVNQSSHRKSTIKRGSRVTPCMQRYAHPHISQQRPPFLMHMNELIEQHQFGFRRGVSYCNISGGRGQLWNGFAKKRGRWGLKAVTCIMDWKLSLSHQPYVCGEGVLMESITFAIHCGICSFNGKISLCRRFYLIKILIKKWGIFLKRKVQTQCLRRKVVESNH